MMNRYVYGTYDSFAEAERQADRIINSGVPKSAVSLVSNMEVAENAQANTDYDYIRSEKMDDNRNWFEKLFGLGDDHADEEIDFRHYEDSLRNNQILLVVDGEYEAQLTDLSTDRAGYGTYATAEEEIGVAADTADVDTRRETENIRLHEERLNVGKEKRETGEVEIHKEVVEETQTIDVPVEREEIHIKHKTPTDNTADGDAFTEEEIVIPVSEERVVVDKETVVTDEVEIEKETHVDHETVRETTRREELDIEEDTDHNLHRDR